MRNEEACVGIAMLNYNSAPSLEVALDSLARMNTGIRCICSVLDNASGDCEEARAVFAEFQQRCPERAGEFVSVPKNLGYAGGNNVLIKTFLENPAITHIMLANSDIAFTDLSMDRLIAANVDVIGPVTGMSGSVQTIETGLDPAISTESLPAINAFARERYATYADELLQASFLTFFCVLLSRALVETVGFLDEQFFPGAYEDDDYCMRILKSGYKMYCARGVVIYHWGYRSFQSLPEKQREKSHNVNLALFEKKWDIKWKSRSADPLESCREDIFFLLKKAGLSSHMPAIQGAFARTSKQLLEQEGALGYYIGQVQYTLPPVRRNIRPMSGSELVHRMGRKIKNRIKMLLGRPVPAGATGFDHTEPAFSELFAQLIERLAFRLSAPLHRRAEAKEERELSARQLQTITDIVSAKGLPAILFLAPYPHEIYLRDGYYKRIKAVDDIFAENYLRVYVEEYPVPIQSLRISRHGERVFSILYNKDNAAHMAQIAALANQCTFLYNHSCAVLNIDLVRQITIPKFLDVHGVGPEENHMYGKFEVERLLAQAEAYGVEHYDKLVFVTDALRLHIEQKYARRLSNTVLLPTYDETALSALDVKDPLPADGRYTVIYSGGTQKWQRVDLMLDAVEKNRDVNYKFFTPDVDTVREECLKRGIQKSLEPRSLSPEALVDEYRKSQFGFVLRDDIVVNRVACPTKLMEYLAYGIIPIVLSPNIGDFAQMGMQYVTYDDFLAGRLPPEDERLSMARENLAIAHRLADIYNKGRQDLGDAVRELQLSAAGISPKTEGTKGAIGLVVGSFDKGGLEQVAFNLYKGYRAAGYAAYVLCENDVLGYFSGELDDPSHLCMFGADPDVFFAFCREKGIRVLHYHYNTFQMAQARVAGIHTMYTLHNVYTWMSDDEIRARAVLLNTANSIVAVSTFVKNYYCARTNTPYSRVQVIPNGIDTRVLDGTALAPALTREKLGIGPKEITLGFCAAFFPAKHQMNMIGAMERIVARKSNIKLLFAGNVGDAAYYNDLRTAWEASSARANILFTPYVDHGQMGEYLRQTVDIFVLPTIQEGCSNAVLEALYTARPMVLTDVGNAADLRDVKSISVVGRPYEDLLSFRQQDIDVLCRQKECINTEDLAQAILDMADNLEERKKTAADAARAYKTLCGVEQMNKLYIDAIEQIF